MQQYIHPELDIIKFSVLDVICASDIAPVNPVDPESPQPAGAEKENAYVSAGSLNGGGRIFF